MFKSLKLPLVLLVCALLTIATDAQVSTSKSATDSSSAQRAADLAQTGHCREALPLLRKSLPAVSDKDVKRRMSVSGLRCAMSLDRRDQAMDFIRVLNRDFSADPEVLYVLVHAYSDLSTRASVDLARTAPSSYQAHELNAESLEIQGKWDDAEKEYRAILQRNPQAPGIHYRLGRILLSKPNPAPTVFQDAKKEFEQEVSLDPKNAGAEYILGELARKESQLPEAIQHFSRATKLDAGFGDAFLGLGTALIASKKFSEAIPPLQNAAKLQPDNPATHYNLAMAYSRAGQKEQAAQEFALHRKTAAAAQAARDPQAPQPLPAAEAPQ